MRILPLALSLACLACGRANQQAELARAHSTSIAAGAPEATPTVWPPLPTSGFLVGRPAVKEDVKAGNALFVAEAMSRGIGKPLDIAIPQYAFLTDSKTHRAVPVIVVQAEEANNLKIVGYRTVNGGQNGLALLNEFKLLGTAIPGSND